MRVKGWQGAVSIILWLTSSCRDSSNHPSTALIDGRWTSSCTSLGTGSELVEYTFSAAFQVQRVEQYFQDRSCSSLDSETKFFGVYELLTTNQDYVYAIDMFFTEVLATPLNLDSAAQWQAVSYCGISSWSKAESQNVTLATGENCRSFGVARVEYRDLVQIERDRSLHFGTDLNHLAARPLAVASDQSSRSFTAILP